MSLCQHGYHQKAALLHCKEFMHNEALLIKRSYSNSSDEKDGQLSCPKCGNPCSQVETFVCKLESSATKSTITTY